MARARINDVTLAYEIHGSGTPLLLITGLGGAMSAWQFQIQDLARRHQVIVLDNRGVGASDQPPGPYSITTLAADSVGLLDHLGIAAAHIFGVSLGGMIAQQVALDWPERVRGLVLGCTTCGANDHVFAEPRVMESLLRMLELPRAEALRRSIAINFAPGFAEAQPERIEAFMRMGLDNNQSEQGYLAQLAAVWGHGTCDRLAELSAPTLVIHGACDVLIPIANGSLLAQRIPVARFLELAGAGHCFFIEQPELTNRAVLDFLAEIEQPSLVSNQALER